MIQIPIKNKTDFDQKLAHLNKHGYGWIGSPADYSNEMKSLVIDVHGQISWSSELLPMHTFHNVKDLVSTADKANVQYESDLQLVRAALRNFGQKYLVDMHVVIGGKGGVNVDTGNYDYNFMAAVIATAVDRMQDFDDQLGIVDALKQILDERFSRSS